MGIDKRSVSHGKFTECNECDEYETSGSNILCEYCGHRPEQHEVISQISASGSQVGSELEPPEKRPKPAEEEEQNNDVSDGENEVTMIDNAESCVNDNTHREDDLNTNKEFFPKVCKELALEHQKTYSVSCKFEPQINSEGKVKLVCQICDVQITPGLTKQRLFNVRRNFMNSSCHKAKVISLADRDNVSSESVVNLDMDEGKKIAFLKKISPGTFELKGSHVLCSYCVGNSRTIYLNPNHGSFENNVRSHLQSKQPTAQQKVKNKYGNTILNPKVLLHDGHVSPDGGEILWYGEPYFQSGTITGSFRHGDCRRFGSIGTFVNSICSACHSIPKIDSFRLKLQRHTDSNVNDSSTTNFTYLTRDQLLLKIREAEEQVECYRRRVFWLSG
ncbi:unnamed protein product [Porites evermanni]|uniref:Uncharacterized protein n=1 Tax=Porites evermanni TaxID=104178 RepID=A0ABN8SQ92_9CNID|nr:unnamed protein product [Porites evermanni]